MNARHEKKDSNTQTNPKNRYKYRLNFGIVGILDLSKITNPNPPIVKRKLEARPSMMY